MQVKQYQREYKEYRHKSLKEMRLTWLIMFLHQMSHS